jgi:hypothetical protein
MFTVEERERIRGRLTEMARVDPRVESAAAVGASALGGGDRWSDLDLTFGLAEGASMEAVLSDRTRSVESEFDALTLFDLPFRSSIYRVFLVPGSLQVDLSFTPGPEFGAFGPKFALLFGTATERDPLAGPSPTRPGARTGRGFDELPADIRERTAGALARSLERAELLRALYYAVDALLRESEGIHDEAAKLEAQLRELVSGSPD